jgi:hypothetical protein
VSPLAQVLDAEQLAADRPGEQVLTYVGSAGCESSYAGRFE